MQSIECTVRPNIYGIYEPYWWPDELSAKKEKKRKQIPEVPEACWVILSALLYGLPARSSPGGVTEGNMRVQLNCDFLLFPRSAANWLRPVAALALRTELTSLWIIVLEPWTSVFLMVWMIAFAAPSAHAPRGMLGGGFLDFEPWLLWFIYLFWYQLCVHGTGDESKREQQSIWDANEKRAEAWTHSRCTAECVFKDWWTHTRTFRVPLHRCEGVPGRNLRV